MASVEELLASMSEPEEQARVILTIDEDLRIVTIPGIALVIGAEGDKDVNRLWFKMSRNYRGSDLAGFTPKINYNNAAGGHYYYISTDMELKGDSLIFSWLISDKAAEERGTVEFSVCMQKYEDDELVQEFNTTTASMTCLKSIHEKEAKDDTPINGMFAFLDTAVLDEAFLG